jgi:signal transduction histidine kinase
MVNALVNLSTSYQQYSPDSELVYAQQALALAEKLDYSEGIFWAETAISGALIFTANYPLELENGFKALALSKKLKIPRATGYANGMLSDYYYNLGDYTTSLSYWLEAKKIAERWFPGEMYAIWGNLSRIYDGMDQHDSAMWYAKKTYAEIKVNKDLNSNDSLWMTSLTSTLLGNAFAGNRDYDSAIFYYRAAVPASIHLSIQTNLIDSYNGIARAYKATGKQDSAVWYAAKVLTSATAKSYPVSLLKAANLLSGIYESTNKPDSALKYLHRAIAIKDSLFSREKMIAIQNLTYNEQEKQQEIKAAEIKLRNRFILYFLLASFLALLVVSGIVLKNKRQKQLQNIRNSIANDLHDDIGSALSSISIMNELAKAKPARTLHLLNSIGENTNSIQENMSDIIWAVNSKNDRFENIALRMNQFSSEILEAKNATLDFKSDASLSALKLAMVQRKNFYLFFKEAINNAAKYACAKKVSVCITKKKNHIEMYISDDGKGFDTGQNFSGNGMNTLRKRAAELAAVFKITSIINEGTVVELTFKIN